VKLAIWLAFAALIRRGDHPARARSRDEHRVWTAELVTTSCRRARGVRARSGLAFSGSRVDRSFGDASPSSSTGDATRLRRTSMLHGPCIDGFVRDVAGAAIAGARVELSPGPNDREREREAGVVGGIPRRVNSVHSDTFASGSFRNRERVSRRRCRSARADSKTWSATSSSSVTDARALPSRAARARDDVWGTIVDSEGRAVAAPRSTPPRWNRTRETDARVHAGRSIRAQRRTRWISNALRTSGAPRGARGLRRRPPGFVCLARRRRRNWRALEVRLAKGAIVRGRVVDEHGQVVAGARIQCANRRR